MASSTELPTGMPDDAPSATVVARAAVPAAALWEIVTDINAPAAHSDEFVGADWLDGADGPALGARFEGRNVRGEMAWTTVCTVTAWEPGRRFGWTVLDLDDPVSSWTYELVEDGDGTQLQYTARMGPSARSGLNRAIAKHPDRAVEFTTARLATLAESMQRAVDAFAREAEEESRG